MERDQTSPFYYNPDEGTQNQLFNQVEITKSVANQLDLTALAKSPSICRITDYEEYRITDTTPIEPPIPIITIVGEIISTEGNITTFSGASKAGKSALTAICIAGAICKNGELDGLKGLNVAPNIHGKAVIHIDTEQARHRQQSNVKSIIKRAKLFTCPDYYLSYNIRLLALEEYSAITEGVLEAAHEEFGGIHLVVIDGIADYITDVNEPETSNSIVKFFEGLAIKYSVPIIVIVHTNPGSDKERGHLGSQLQRKSESVIAVKLEGDISFMEPKFLRSAGKGNIPQLSFKYCKEKGYHVDNGVMSDPEDRKEKAKMDKVLAICTKVFSGQVSLSYNEAKEKIKEVSGKGITTTKGYFTTMNENGWIKKGDDGNWRYNGLILV